VKYVQAILSEKKHVLMSRMPKGSFAVIAVLGEKSCRWTDLLLLMERGNFTLKSDLTEESG